MASQRRQIKYECHSTTCQLIWSKSEQLRQTVLLTENYIEFIHRKQWANSSFNIIRSISRLTIELIMHFYIFRRAIVFFFSTWNPHHWIPFRSHNYHDLNYWQSWMRRKWEKSQRPKFDSNRVAYAIRVRLSGSRFKWFGDKIWAAFRVPLLCYVIGIFLALHFVAYSNFQF